MRSFLRNIKLLSAIGFVLLIAIIWLFGYAFGFSTIESRLVAVVMVMLAWVAALLIGRLFAARASRLIEHMFRAQVDGAVMQATPEHRSEVALLRKQLLEAIETLQKSNLGRTRGRAALYELPWYMVIGHPAAGKSSAIQNSGLVFPLADKDKQAIRGVGGTRNCDWFFTTEGVLLDTAGRYATQSEDRAEWLEFLRLLKSRRPRMPINGILVAISFPELVQFKSEGFAAYARQIRARINEVDQAFARKVPVYLIFTKIDLLGGFTQFFEEMTEAHRSHVWGATLSHEQGEKFDPVGAVTEQFELLYRGLAEMGAEKLAVNRGADAPALFAFPVEFNAMRDAVLRFVEILFEDDPYHTRPLLRGFYFTSALQEGAPKIPAGLRISSRFDLVNAGFSPQKPPDSRSFFLRDLFRDVIFQDQYLIGRVGNERLSRSRWAGLALGFLVLLGLLGAWSMSFYQNLQVSKEAAEEFNLFNSTKIVDRLARLNFIQMRLDTLEKYRRESHPIAMGFGLYQGERLEQHLSDLYASELKQLLLVPVRAELEAALSKHSTALSGGGADIASTATADSEELAQEKYYDVLKTYLMLHHSDRLEIDYLSDQLGQHWMRWLDHQRGAASMDEIAPLAEHIVAYYLRNFSSGRMPLIENNDQAVGEARAYLNGAMRRLPAKERVYSDLIAQAASTYPSLNLARILDNTDADSLSNSYTIPAAYTRAAWDGYMRKAIDEASRGVIKDDDWVLGSESIAQKMNPADFENNRNELLTLYKEAYAREWRNFLAGLSVNNFHGLDDAINRVNRLSDYKESPMRRVFARVSYETSWDNPHLLKQTAPKVDKDIKTAIVDHLLADRNDAEAAESSYQVGELEDRFSLFARMTSEATGSPTLVPYLGALGKLKSRLESIKTAREPGKAARTLMKNTMDSSTSELVDGMQIVDSQLLIGADADLREILKPLLLKPFVASYGSLLPLANSDINQAWQRQVYPFWLALSDKYPFIDAGSEAQLSDIAKFVQSDEGPLSKFLNETLEGLLSRQGNQYVPRRWSNMSVPFNKAFLHGISQASIIEQKVFIDRGDSRFELQPVPSPGISEVVIEIDGQQLRYRNGPQLWTTFTWPTAQSGQGAKISAITFGGVSSVIASNPGRMGWVRMVSQAKTSAVAPGTTQLTWVAKSPAGASTEKIEIRFNLRQVSGANPLAMHMLRDLNFPKKIIN